MGMDIGETDLEVVFDVLDRQRSGEVAYKEFTRQLWKMKSQEIKTSVMFVKHSVHEMHKEMADQLDAQSKTMKSHELSMHKPMQQLAEVLSETRRDVQKLVFSKSASESASVRSLRVSIPEPPKIPRCL